MNIKILSVEDNKEIRDQIIEYFDKSVILEHTIHIEDAEDFDVGIEKIKNGNYDIVLLDLCKGVPQEDNSDRTGLKALEEIRKNTFCTVIFYSGLAHKITELNSPIVSVINKSDGLGKLEEEVTKMISSNIGLLKQKINNHINEALREFFWETVHVQKDIFQNIDEETSLGYLMLRRIANSLSNTNIKKLTGDDAVEENKAHPMEFYIFPTNSTEYEAGEILFLEDIYYIILTPSCDFVKSGKRPRKVGNVLLVAASPISETEKYSKFIADNDKGKQALAQLIESRGNDRYFFLPKTPFLIDHLLIDFQNKRMTDYDELKNFTRIAKLDSPFAESIFASFIRYYNRVGFPDIDSEYILKNILESTSK